MSYIKFINEDNNISYNTVKDVEQLIYYIYGGMKSSEDTIRPGGVIGDFNGCIPFIGPEYMSHDPYAATNLILLNNRLWGHEAEDLMKHRVISFRDIDYILPKDAYDLAVYLIHELYNDYITVFGVHLDTEMIHIHIGINTVNRWNGNRFSVSFEKKRMRALVSAWKTVHDERIDNDIKLKDKYEKYLFVN